MVAAGAAFELSKYGNLHVPEEWAAGKSWFGKKEEIARTYLLHTSEPIHKSITKFEPEPGQKGSRHKELAKDACRQFKNLLGVCGERKIGSAEQLGQVPIRHRDLHTVSLHDSRRPSALRIRIGCRPVRRSPRCAPSSSLSS